MWSDAVKNDFNVVFGPTEMAERSQEDMHRHLPVWDLLHLFDSHHKTQARRQLGCESGLGEARGLSSHRCDVDVVLLKTLRRCSWSFGFKLALARFLASAVKMAPRGDCRTTFRALDTFLCRLMPRQPALVR